LPPVVGSGMEEPLLRIMTEAGIPGKAGPFYDGCGQRSVYIVAGTGFLLCKTRPPHTDPSRAYAFQFGLSWHVWLTSGSLGIVVYSVPCRAPISVKQNP
jgi:hypothetical protein